MDQRLLDLRHVLGLNESVDWRAFNFQADPDGSSICWGEYGAARAALLQDLRAYQRLLRILPNDEAHRSFTLMAAGFRSAVQIAAIPQSEFARRWTELFPDAPDLAAVVHQNAIGQRARVLLHQINQFQSREPHYLAARFK